MAKLFVLDYIDLNNNISGFYLKTKEEDALFSLQHLGAITDRPR